MQYGGRIGSGLWCPVLFGWLHYSVSVLPAVSWMRSRSDHFSGRSLLHSVFLPDDVLQAETHQHAFCFVDGFDGLLLIGV